MRLDGVFRPFVHHMPPPVGPTLVSLSNARRNAIRRPPRHHIIVRKNCTTHGRIGQSSIPRLPLANNGGMACTEQVEGSSHGNCRANQSNPLVLPFLDMHTRGGSSCIPPLSMRRESEVTNDNNPFKKQMKRIIWTNVISTSTIELWNLPLEVEGEI